MRCQESSLQVIQYGREIKMVKLKRVRMRTSESIEANGREWTDEPARRPGLNKSRQ